MSAASARIQVASAIARMSYPDYAERFLKIRTKTEGVKPFNMNVGQLYLHRKIEVQIAQRGFARVVLAKARQWGGSTYVQGRSYYRVAAKGTPGMRSFILTHHADATSNLFRMTHRFHLLMDPRIRPAANPPSQRQIVFPKLDSSYGVATAGSMAIGRSDTIQFFHGSEVAYWPNAEDHLTGALQAVPSKGIGTEVYLESTGNGMGNVFHQQFSLARAGLSDYEAVFVPWAWFPHKVNGEREYSAPVSGLDLTTADEEYAELWGLTEEQMQFRQDKIAEFGGGEAGRARFAVEYPMTPEEAFSKNVAGGYIEAKYVLLARRMLPFKASRYGPKILGIDPSWTGDDRFICWIRHGRYAKRVGRWSGLRAPQSVMRIKAIIEKEKPDVLTMDVGGLGGPMFDDIALVAPPNLIMIPVLGGEQADDPERWPRKRAECYGRMRAWFEDPIGPCIDDATAKSEDERTAALEEIQGDITCILTDWDTRGRPIPETKKKTLSHSPSPDNADSLATTFCTVFGPDWKPQSHDAMEHARRAVDWRAM